jgi:hypothetical protein
MPGDAREWQAKMIDISGCAPYHVNQMRDEMGREGWEPVGFDSQRILFKRPASPPTRVEHAPTEEKGDLPMKLDAMAAKIRLQANQ